MKKPVALKVEYHWGKGHLPAPHQSVTINADLVELAQQYDIMIVKHPDAPGIAIYVDTPGSKFRRGKL
jgi:hypothetical protein